MNKTAPPLGGSAGETGSSKNKSSGHIGQPAPTVQPPPKPHVCRAVAPPLPACRGGDTVATILELVALHLRRTIPALSDLTLADFDVVFADLRPQLRELLDGGDKE